MVFFRKQNPYLLFKKKILEICLNTLFRPETEISLPQILTIPLCNSCFNKKKKKKILHKKLLYTVILVSAF